ncbi:MAG: ester cyclase [Arthrobacter sp.]|nr:ester cyclase [Arthrobacter sp.]MCU1548775.1 ester cyclase [Arthrobacter sp.]
MADGTGLIKRFYTEVMEAGNLARIDELLNEGFVDHEALPGQPPGRDGARFFANTMRTAFPDIKVKTAEPALAEGNLEALHVVLTGTHQGDMMGVAATGRSVEFDGVDIIRVEDGKIAEHWGARDTLTLLQQIGAIPG